MSDSIISFFEYLTSKYPPTLSIRHVSEITNETEQTIRNGVSKGAYPIPSFKLGRKRLFRLTDVATFIDQQFQLASSPKAQPKPIGRPTKAAQIAKRRLNMHESAGGA